MENNNSKTFEIDETIVFSFGMTFFVASFVFITYWLIKNRELLAMMAHPVPIMRQKNNANRELKENRSFKTTSVFHEEFNNFMHRVNEVSRIVNKLGSKNKKTQDIGIKEADQYLNDDKEVLLEKLCEETIKLKVKSDRTVINKKALLEDDGNQETMSQEAFMEHVSKDADKRYQDKLIRREKADTFKTQATKAFRRGEYEKALTLYNKAIEQIKDSCMLYMNRSLTQMNLKRYDKAIEDAEKALYWNENSMKARLLLSKYQLLIGNKKEFEKEILKAKEKHPDQVQFITDYAEELLKTN